MSTISILVVSLVFIRNIPVALLPDTPIPKLSVQISAPDLDARTLETTIVRTIRNQLLQVNNLNDISSRTHNGTAVINLDLKFGTNTDLASIELNEKMDQILTQLPKTLERPRVVKTNISDIPVFYFDLYVKDTSLITETAFSLFVKKTLRKRLEQIPEIAFVDIHGITKPEVIVIPKTDILLSLQADESVINEALLNGNMQLGNIILKDGAYQYNVRLSSKLNNIEDIKNIYVNINNHVYQLSELAEVRYTTIPKRGVFFYNDHSGASLAVRSKSNANNFKLRKALQDLLFDLEAHYPEIAFRLSNDQSKILEAAIINLRTSLYYGLSFAAIIIFFFFKDWRSPILIITTIPISIILTLFGFYLLDISVNVVSLTGLILGVGLMIDNAIIIIENIKYKSNKLDIKSSAVLGTNEVINPLISSALTTSSVFLPLILLSGLAGSLFYDQAISIALALTCSLLVSYFFLPILSSLLFKKHRKKADKQQNNLHRTIITWTLNHRNLLIPVFIVLAGLTLIPYNLLNKKAFPRLTRMEFTLDIDWNEQLTLEENSNRYIFIKNSLTSLIDKSSAYIGELQYFFTDENQHLNESQIIFQLKEAASISNIEKQLKTTFKRNYPEANYSISPLQNVFDKVFNQDNNEVYAHIQSTTSLNLPTHIESQQLLSAIPLKYGEIFSLPLDKFIGINIRHEQLLRYDIDQSALLRKLKFLFRDNQLTYLRGGDELVPIQLSKSTSLSNIKDVLESAHIKNAQGVLLPIVSFIDIGIYQEYKSISSIRTGECLTIPFKKYSLELIQDVKNIINEYPNFIVQFSGSYFEGQQIRREILNISGVVFLLLFLILAAQFESIIQPLIVVMTLPIGILGALLALYVFGQSINIIAIIGIIIMSGIDVNDAILKIDIINKCVKDGMSLNEAIIVGSGRRIRPVLMTSITTILAMTPILFSDGLGAELQRPLAIAVIGGLIFGTIASILVIPMLYRVTAQLMN